MPTASIHVVLMQSKEPWGTLSCFFWWLGWVSGLTLGQSRLGAIGAIGANANSMTSCTGVHMPVQLLVKIDLNLLVSQYHHMSNLAIFISDNRGSTCVALEHSVSCPTFLPLGCVCVAALFTTQALQGRRYCDYFGNTIPVKHCETIVISAYISNIRLIQWLLSPA